jgi:hypothetical protein
MNSVTLFQRHILPPLVEPEFESTRDHIKIGATAAQVIFGIGLAFSIARTVRQLGLFLSGGSLLLLVFHGCEAALYHDLFRVSSNVSSIFKSEVSNRFLHAYLKNLPEFFSSVWNSKDTFEDSIAKLTSSLSFTKAMTKETLIACHFNPEIAKILDL